jgi:hypothetical protein
MNDSCQTGIVILHFYFLFLPFAFCLLPFAIQVS